MELSIAATKVRGAGTAAATPYKAKCEAKKPREASKVEKKDVHTITSKSTKFSFKTKRTEGGLNLGDSKRLTMKEMQAKEYPFFESDIPRIFEELLKAKMIKLPKAKRLEEAKRSTEPNYCKYHRILGHPIKKCFVFKEKFMDLVRQGAILLEEDKVSTNHVTLTILKKAEVKEPEDFWKRKLKPDAKFYQKRKTDGLQPTERLEAPKPAQPSHPNIGEKVIAALKGLTLPLNQVEKVASTTHKGFVTAVQGPNIKHRTMNPKAYDLLVKAGYDPTKDAAMSRPTPEVKVHGLNETQEKLQRKGYFIKSSTAGLEYISNPPLHVMIKWVSNYHITEVEQGPCTNPGAATRNSVFQRLGATPTIAMRYQQRSVFQMLGKNAN
ncbi:hypothetical protein LIER_15643 [Lithospermum erythrorhizon]|uniref:Retrotransposon gag protein n=1 Tax=Lithospermum erythrorhizon TaxID=34254 RepID=A0AAV3Q5A4_LITER